MQDDYYFQQNNDTRHIARVVHEWILYHVPRVLTTLAQNPNINLIGNLSSEIDRKLREHNTFNKKILREENWEIWNTIEPNNTLILVQSMQNRLSEIIKHKGGSTKY